MKLSADELECLVHAMNSLVESGKREYGPDWVTRPGGLRALALRTKVRTAATKARKAAEVAS